jgi:hypothetical protein
MLDMLKKMLMLMMPDHVHRHVLTGIASLLGLHNHQTPATD